MRSETPDRGPCLSLQSCSNRYSSSSSSSSILLPARIPLSLVHRRRRQVLRLLSALSAVLLCLCRLELSLAFTSHSSSVLKSSPWQRPFVTRRLHASIDSMHRNNNDSAKDGGDKPKQTKTMNVNDESGSDEGRPASLQQQRHYSFNTLSPYQILHPSLFNHDPAITCADRRLPLHSCLKLLQQSLHRLIQDDGVLPRRSYGMDKDDDSLVLRIQHDISHRVDPLGWLHAHVTTTTTASEKEDTLYFCNAEETLEAAVYGAAYRYTNATSTTTSSESNSTQSFWEWLQDNLPQQSLLYGGERFDTESTPDAEWQGFCKGLYILPAIEVKRVSETIHGTYDGNDNDDTRSSSGHTTTTTSIAVHLCRRDRSSSWKDAAQHTLATLQQVTDRTSSSTPPTTLPPIITRESNYGRVDGQEIYERGVSAALEEFERHNASSDALQKVVLARRMDLTFDKASVPFTALDVLRKWKYGNNEGGHLFYLSPGVVQDSSTTTLARREFFGCSPERLFQIRHGRVRSEALAGTRPRGSTQEADVRLCRDLFESPKDREENLITGRFIQRTFTELEQEGKIDLLLQQSGGTNFTAERRQRELLHSVDLSTGSSSIDNGRFFVRRLRHLQHICEHFEGTMKKGVSSVDVSQFLQQKLHPTPAVCGYPKQQSLEFIRRSESVAFDRGFYAGPFGCYGRDSADVIVAIRSGLMSMPVMQPRQARQMPPSLSVYAGAGIVPGSTVQGEWTETSYKIGVISSIFPPSPLTLQSVSSPNVAWASAFLEELVRCGVTQFYVCPGSRSTPLVAALSKTLRAHVGVVYAQSIHDERSAGFRALGFARAAGRPAAVITSSGTAVANLYPSIMEAGMDGVPMLLLTADRPYESRATGSNQAVDQVKAFSSTYLRWFRDIPPPSDDVPVSLALSDADHAVNLARTLRGPVHLNIQFRENLAPEGGPVRNDDRVDSVTRFNGFRFTDVPGFQRWSVGGGRWAQTFSAGAGLLHYDLLAHASSSVDRAIDEIAGLIRSSRRGIVVVGNVRGTSDEVEVADESRVVEMISNFAQVAGMPIFAGVQSGSLRFRSPAVVPYAEHLLKHPAVRQNMNPDLVLQIGAPLISTEIPSLISSVIKAREQDDDSHAILLSHVLLHPHHPQERADPDFSVTHHVSSEIYPFVKSLTERLEALSSEDVRPSSDLTPLVLLGRTLQKEMPGIIHESSRIVIETTESTGSARSHLTEPQVVLAMRDVIRENEYASSIFLSNSMPVRDAEFFLYPDSDVTSIDNRKGHDKIADVGVNRGASGIDGVISAAAGFAESTEKPTTLLIGDLAALHDINAFHALSGNRQQQSSSKKGPPLTTVVVDNDGGGIFSFLPVAKHGNDVNFEDFFGTPTNSFLLHKAAEAFGLKYRQAWSFKTFVAAYSESITGGFPCIVEATVASREENVAVHREITSRVISFLDDTLQKDAFTDCLLPMKIYREAHREDDKRKTMVLLHGWMGDKLEWDPVGSSLARSLPPEWTILSLDLPGHGDSPLRFSSDMQAIRASLGLHSDEDIDDSGLSVDDLSVCVLRTLKNRGVKSIDALAGYSLGGRVSLAMMRASRDVSTENMPPALITEDTRLVLLSTYPGELPSARKPEANRVERAMKDERLYSEILSTANRDVLRDRAESENPLVWSSFLRQWYGAALWGEMQSRDSSEYRQMLSRRTSALASRGRDLANVLKDSSPGDHSSSAWRSVYSSNTLYVSGSLDSKYARIGKLWERHDENLVLVELPDVGHAVISEAPDEVSSVMYSFLTEEKREYPRGEASSAAPFLVSSQGTGASRDGTQRKRIADLKQGGRREKMATSAIWNQLTIGSLDFETYSLYFQDSSAKVTGWSDSAKNDSDKSAESRTGLILQIVSSDGSAVGIGEVSPLAGVHPESLQDAQCELETIQRRMQRIETLFLPTLDAAVVLGLDGGLGEFIDTFLDTLEIDSVSQSVRAGLEMALLSIAAQVVRMPLLQALIEYTPEERAPKSSSVSNALLLLNGIHMRDTLGSAPKRNGDESQIGYPSVKVKVGHQTAEADEAALVEALRQTDSMVRADANRAWDQEAAIHFGDFLKLGNTLTRLEYVEEPLKKQSTEPDLGCQVDALEQWQKDTTVPYALDETIAELAAACKYDFVRIQHELLSAFPGGPRGCAAIVLKPTLLGMELTMRLARLAHDELDMGAVVSSCFDSGVGLAYAAFLGAASSHRASSRAASYSHGLGTFRLLRDDTLSPSFSSYVTKHGELQVSSLSRALFGLGLDELRDSAVLDRLVVPPETTQPLEQSYSYRSESGGRELSVVVSLPLPFSDDIACARFGDLPQMTRWTPWLSSVAYLDTGSETEWTLNIRGVRFKWRATSTLLESPYRGIQWESVSGVKNVGIVEFIPTSSNACLMKVRMTIVPPRMIATLFPPGASVFAEDFLQNKLLKWSLEMFRDVVKGDLALERGDVELGDALFGAAEGRANAIEATLSNSLEGSTKNGETVSKGEEDEETSFG